MKTQKCPRCKTLRLKEDFGIRRLDIPYKTCIHCREREEKYRKTAKKCEHGKKKYYCKDCGGKGICEHDREINKCKDCKGSQICEHNRIRNACKDCKGSQICEHNRIRNVCKKCGGSQICEHNREKHHCKDCKGSQICEHNRGKNKCKDCKGKGICEHNRVKYACKECGGKGICEHDRMRNICVDCGGSQICEHHKRRNCCKICDPDGYLVDKVRKAVNNALKSNKTKRSMEYIDCNVKTLRKHIEEQFEEGMTWENHGKWHIDHITPIKYRENEKDPSLEEIIERLHYTNLQPLWASSNMSKSNRYIG